MTEAEWLACTDPTPMLEYLRDKVSNRRLRLLVCACCRQFQGWLTDERSLVALKAGELYADQRASRRDLLRIEIVAGEVLRPWPFPDNSGPIERRAARMAYLAGSGNSRYTAVQVTHMLAAGEKAPAIPLVHDIFGNFFRPSPPLPPAVLAWSDGTVRRLAQAIYDDRWMPAGTLETACLAILADALLDAGCQDEALIDHCRQPGPHVRGCWAVDLILGRE
jgi:hypothetical protein